MNLKHTQAQENRVLKRIDACDGRSAQGNGLAGDRPAFRLKILP